MSDTIGVLPRVNEPAPEIARANGAIRCPHCEAELRNARAEAGQAMRCLNCGKRFVPIPGEVQLGTAETSEIRRSTREVKTPGYWLLRIPAILICVIGSFTGTMILYDFFLRRSGIRFRDLAFLSYVPLLSVGGFALLWLTKSLADLDGSLARLLERRSPGNADLPPLSGSSLPYILPLAVIGGIMPIASAGMNDSIEQTISFAVFGAMIFLSAFALEDVRQFLWRQCEFFTRLQNIPNTSSATRISALAMAFVLLGLSAATILKFEHISRSDVPFFVFGMLLLFSCALSFGRLDNRFTSMASSWQQRDSVNPEPFLLFSPLLWIAGTSGALFFCVVFNPGADAYSSSFPEVFARIFFCIFVLGPLTGLAALLIHQRLWRASNSLPLRTRIFALFPVLWALFGALFLVFASVQFSFPIRTSEFVGGALAASSGFFAAIWVSDFLIRWMVFRHGMQRTLGIASETISLQSYQWRFILGTVGLVGVQFISITLEIIDSSSWYRTEQYFILPLALGLFHYPTLWFMALLNELWRARATLNADVEAALEE